MRSFPFLSRRPRHLDVWLALSLIGGCGASPERVPDAGSSDAADVTDGANMDAGSDDAGDVADAGDANDDDAGYTGPPYIALGLPCTDDGECLQGACWDHQPDGYCSGGCATSADCGANGVCADGECFAACSPGPGCERPGYFCIGVTSNDSGGGPPIVEHGCYARAIVGGVAFLPDGITLDVTDQAGGTITLTQSGGFRLPNRIPIEGTYNVSFEAKGDLAGVSCVGTHRSGTVTRDVWSIEIECIRRPPPPADLGDACADDAACSVGPCLDEPGGYCSAGCGSDADCGADDVCVDGRCWEGCATQANCTRPGYFCTGVDIRWDQGQGGFREYFACAGGKSIGGTAVIPAGVSVVVTDAAAGSRTLTASGPFALPTRLLAYSDYSVTVTTQGGVQGISCVAKRLTGRADDDVTDIEITCGRQAVFTEPGTHAWVVPPGVTSVSVVVVGAGGLGGGAIGGGGGELCYQNAIPVTPGATIQVVVGDLRAEALSDHDTRFNGTLVAHGGHANLVMAGGTPGGSGGTVGTCFAGGYGYFNSSSGGAAGYAGNGGSAAVGAAPIQNGAGGGGGGGLSFTPGGGVGLEGIGANGIAPGGNGSQATPDVPVAGGGGTTYSGNIPLTGGHGGVRIIWGAGRSYPSQAGNL
jgi:hypothetical protein